MNFAASEGPRDQKDWPSRTDTCLSAMKISRDVNMGTRISDHVMATYMPTQAYSVPPALSTDCYHC